MRFGQETRRASSDEEAKSEAGRWERSLKAGGGSGERATRPSTAIIGTLGTEATDGTEALPGYFYH